MLSFNTKTRTIILFTNTTLNRLSFLLPNETEDMLVHQSNPLEVELFSYVNTSIGFMLDIFCTEIYASEVKLHISSFDLFSRKQRWFLSKRLERLHHIQPNYSFLFVRKVLQIS